MNVARDVQAEVLESLVRLHKATKKCDNYAEILNQATSRKLVRLCDDAQF